MNFSFRTAHSSMECFIVDQQDVNEEERSLVLKGDEAHHVRVLRIRTEEKVLVTNLLGTCYECELDSVSDKSTKEPEAVCHILGVLPSFGEPENNVMLIQALIAQPARWEWLLEKATELGVKVIQPITSERTERSNVNLGRAERILRAAVKQTKRANMPWLKELSSLEEALIVAVRDNRRIYLLHEATDASKRLDRELNGVGNDRLAIVVGPEGGFSDAEVAQALLLEAHPVSLGRRRLRAETAAIAALAIVIQ
jgi:16S rRNA (uracil1498-N3)-methyltransferase